MTATLIPAAFSALGCAGVAWLWGRSLLRFGEPALLGENLQRHRRRLLLLGVGAVVLQLVLLTWNARHHDHLRLAPLASAAALIGVAMAAANFPARRRLLGESWGFPAYLSFGLRLAIGMFGYSLLLVSAPILIGAAAEWRWPLAVLLCALLLGLVFASQRFVPAVLRAAPLVDERLRAPFAAVVARSRLDEVDVFAVPTRGGTWCNAMALPGPRRAVVLFSAALLELLDAAESAAIFAHEVGHLEEGEHWARLRRWRAGLAVAAIVGAAALDTVAGDAQGFTAAFLMPVLLLILARVSGNSRDHETASDRRAVELCGDGAALARALIKLHARAGMVRRMPADVERRATHPSLARRLQAIRSWTTAHAPAPGGGEQGELCVRSRGATPLQVRFGADAIEWDARGRGARRLEYGDLVELRVASGRRGADLQVRLRAGERLSAPLHAADVASVQALLDRVDGRLAPLAPTSTGRQSGVALALFLGSLPLLLAPWARQLDLIALLLVAAVAMQRRRRPWVAAAGAMGVAAALSLLAAGGFGAGVKGALVPLCLLGGGAGALWYVFRAGAADEEDLPVGRARGVLIALLVAALPSLFTFALALLGSETSLLLAAAGRGARGAVLPLVGMGAALALGGRWRRLAGALLLALGMAPPFLASQTYAVRIAGDSLAAEAPPLTYADGVARFAAETVIGEEIDTWDLALAPDGNHVAARRGDPYGEDEEEGPSTFLVASFAGDREAVVALAFGFADAKNGLAVVDDGAGVELALFDLGDLAHPRRRWSLPDAPGDASYSVDASRGKWRVRTWGAGFFATYDGALDDSPVVRRRMDVDLGAAVAYYAGDTGGAYGIGMERESLRPPPWLGNLWVRLRLPWGERSEEVGWLRDGVFEAALRTSLSLSWCEAAALRGDLLCSGDDGQRQHFWAVDPGARSIRPVSAFPGTMDWTWTGERLLALQRDAILVVEPGGRAQRLRLPKRVRWGGELFASGDALVLAEPIVAGDGGWRLRRVEIAGAAGMPD